jgi:hypothetical protein
MTLFKSVIFLGFLFTSCNDVDKGIDVFFNEIGCLHKLPKNAIIVIIPMEGCKSCVSSAIFFLEKNIKNPFFYFIITEINDRKALTQLLGKDILKRKHLALDFSNSWRKHNLASAYPLGHL